MALARGRVVRWLLVWGPVVVWMAIIFFASSLSSPTIPSGVSDYQLHFAVYAGLGLLVTRAKAGGRWRDVHWSTALVAILWVTAYGVTDEVHQAFVPGRDPSVRDVVADALGAVAGASAWWACGIVGSMPRLKDRT